MYVCTYSTHCKSQITEFTLSIVSQIITYVLVATLLHDVLRTYICGPQWAPMASPCTPMHWHWHSHRLSCNLMQPHALLCTPPRTSSDSHPLPKVGDRWKTFKPDLRRQRAPLEGLFRGFGPVRLRPSEASAQ